MEISLGDAAGWASAAVAVIAMLFSLRASREARKDQMRATQLAERQHDFELRSWSDQYFDSVRVWAEQVCHEISTAIHIVESVACSEKQRMDVLIRLSAHIDSGRWYFPNRGHEERGLHKEPAYRGLRQPVLECIVHAYNALRDDGIDGRRERLVSAQRRFVSHVQAVLDPRKRATEIERVLCEFKESEDLRKSDGQKSK